MTFKYQKVRNALLNSIKAHHAFDPTSSSAENLKQFTDSQTHWDIYMLLHNNYAAEFRSLYAKK